MKRSHVVSIVIPVWNNWNLTRACLESLHIHTHVTPFQVVLVDNGSTDATASESPKFGESLFGESFVYVRLPGNMGFAKACNQGAAASSGKFLFFLNNDTTVTKGWLPPLLDAIQGDHRLAGVGPLLLFPQDSIRAGRVQHLGIASHYGPDFLHLYEMFPVTHPVVKKRRKFNVITAAALLMRASLFKAHDGFCEEFINGMEDVDLCCRIAEQGGYFTVIPQSIIYHHTSCTPGRFANESDNYALLKQRCRHTDETFARLITEDGFEPAFTPWLSLIAKLPNERAATLMEAHREAMRTGQFSILQDEPLWDEGYAVLIDEALKNGDSERASMAAHLRSILCPSPDSFMAYADIMEKYGNAVLAREGRNKSNMIRKAVADKARLGKKAKAIERATRDPLILVALEKWTKEHLS